MKEKLLALLKTKFPGVEDAALSRVATKKAETVTDESQLPTIVEGISFQDVLQSYGDYRAGDATTTAVTNYEKKHNLKDGKTITKEPEPGNPPAGPKPTDPTDLQAQIIAAVAAAVKPLSEEISSLKSEKKMTSDKETLISRFKGKGIDEEYYTVAMEGRSFENDEAMEAFAASVETGWGAYSQKLANDGLARLSKPAGGSGPKDGEISSELKARIEKNQKDAVSAAPAIHGLPSNQNS